MDCAVCVGNPLHSHKISRKPEPPDSRQLLHRDIKCHNRYTYQRQIDDSEPSPRAVYMQAEVG